MLSGLLAPKELGWAGLDAWSYVVSWEGMLCTGCTYTLCSATLEDSECKYSHTEILYSSLSTITYGVSRYSMMYVLAFTYVLYVLTYEGYVRKLAI